MYVGKINMDLNLFFQSAPRNFIKKKIVKYMRRGIRSPPKPKEKKKNIIPHTLQLAKPLEIRKHGIPSREVGTKTQKEPNNKSFPKETQNHHFSL